MNSSYLLLLFLTGSSLVDVYCHRIGKEPIASSGQNHSSSHFPTRFHHGRGWHNVPHHLRKPEPQISPVRIDDPDLFLSKLHENGTTSDQLTRDQLGLFLGLVQVSRQMPRRTITAGMDVDGRRKLLFSVFRELKDCVASLGSSDGDVEMTEEYVAKILECSKESLWQNIDEKYVAQALPTYFRRHFQTSLNNSNSPSSLQGGGGVEVKPLKEFKGLVLPPVPIYLISEKSINPAKNIDKNSTTFDKHTTFKTQIDVTTSPRIDFTTQPIKEIIIDSSTTVATISSTKPPKIDNRTIKPIVSTTMDDCTYLSNGTLNPMAYKCKRDKRRRLSTTSTTTIRPSKTTEDQTLKPTKVISKESENNYRSKEGVELNSVENEPEESTERRHQFAYFLQTNDIIILVVSASVTTLTICLTFLGISCVIRRHRHISAERRRQRQNLLLYE